MTNSHPPVQKTLDQVLAVPSPRVRWWRTNRLNVAFYFVLFVSLIYGGPLGLAYYQRSVAGEVVTVNKIGSGKIQEVLLQEKEEEADESADESPTEHTVERGETLIKIAKRYPDLGLDWKELCLENRKVLVLNDCHNIRPGMVLSLLISDNTKGRMGKVGKHFFVPKDRYQVVDCTKSKLGYCVFNRPGGDPVCKKSDQVSVLARDLEIPKETAAKWTTAAKERKLIPAGTFIDGLSFGHGYWKGRVLVKQDMWANVGEVDGKWVGQFELCCNFFPATKPPVPETPPPPPPAASAPPTAASAPPSAASAPPAVETPPVVEETTSEEEKEPLCLLDPKLFLGQEKEPNRGGNKVKSSNLSTALYCTWRGQGGTHGLGFGFMGTWFDGYVNGGAGYFSGRMLAFGPGYEYIADDNWNLEAKLLFGRIHENFAQAQFQEDRTIDFVGPAASLNLGQRRARGEKWFPETRLFGQYGVATSVKANVSNFGQPSDTSEYSQFGSLLQLGVHVDVLDAQRFTLWARVGYFRESPFSESLNLRVGLSDPYRICGVGVGFDFDLQNGGQAFGYGWWCDGVKGVRVVRAEYRLSQIIEETGATFDEDGTLVVPMPTISAKSKD